MAKDKELTTEQQQRQRLRGRCDICEDDGKIILRLEMPGVDKGNLDINVNNNQLEIIGHKRDPDVDGNYLVRERTQGDYYHLYTLDETVDRDKIDASLENGILTVSLQLKEAEKPKKIAVKTGK
jgi:HSP20 family protein